MIGQTITHYRIVEKLGEGGMGVVYKAHDTTLDRAVALKFLPPELTRDAGARERFIREARAASALDHPNICTIHEVSETEDRQTFIAMAYYEGENLKSAIERGPLKLEEILDIATQIALGLAKAHGQGIIHRDIKPANILITKDGLVKIVDFGLAKLAGKAKLTKTGFTLGTAAYMSPEQARGENVDARSDIFSLGAVMYEMITGQRAFPGEYDQATLYAIVNEEPPPVTSLRSGVPMGLERIVKKALAKKASERYQHSDELIVDLKAVAHESVPVIARGAVRQPNRRALRALKIALPAAIVGAVIILLVLLNPFKLQIGLRKTTASEGKSVAVLPFRNLSDSKDDEFFSDGITEDIITQLSNIGELKVISRTSVMLYKSTSKNLREIAKELGVATVLEGSVRRAGNQVRITAQLIDASSDKHLWAQTYDKEMTQIFAIQSDVAQQIAAALKAKLSPRERGHLGKQPTTSIDAYAYYVRGRDYYYRYIKQDNDHAIELFKKALELDPNYALAYAGLGDAYAQRHRTFGLPAVWVDSSIAMSSKSIAIDPALAEGYKALGLGYHEKGWIGRAIETNQKAIEVNPNCWQAIVNIGISNGTVGRYDQAIAWFQRALPLNPVYPATYANLGGAYSRLNDDGKAVELFDKAFALQPDLIPALLGTGWMYIRQGDGERGFDVAQKVFEIQPDDPQGCVLAGKAKLLLGKLAEAETYFEKGTSWVSAHEPSAELGYICWRTGRHERARLLLARRLRDDAHQLEHGSEDPNIPYASACVYSIQGKKSESYYWLQKAIDAGWRDYRWTEVDPLLENIRHDDEFKHMMADVRAKVEEMRKRVEKMDKR